jgi:hypothetical protein
MNDPLTPLEREMVRLTAEKNWPGFRVDGLSVTKRENSGAGRYTYLEDAHHQPLVDGLYGVDYSEVDMEGVHNGLGWVVDVSNGRLLYIEIFTIGNYSWDGVERPWKIR